MVANFNGFASPVQGKMLHESGLVVAFFKTGETDNNPYNQIAIMNSEFLGNNTISGSFEIDNGMGADGTILLTRQ